MKNGTSNWNIAASHSASRLCTIWMESKILLCWDHCNICPANSSHPPSTEYKCYESFLFVCVVKLLVIIQTIRTVNPNSSKQEERFNMGVYIYPLWARYFVTHSVAKPSGSCWWLLRKKRIIILVWFSSKPAQCCHASRIMETWQWRFETKLQNLRKNLSLF